MPTPQPIDLSQVESVTPNTGAAPAQGTAQPIDMSQVTSVEPASAGPAPIDMSKVVSASPNGDYLAKLTPGQITQEGAKAYQNGEISPEDQQKYQDAYASSMDRGGLFGTNTTGASLAAPTPPVSRYPLLNEGLKAIYDYTPNLVLAPVDAMEVVAELVHHDPVPHLEGGDHRR